MKTFVLSLVPVVLRPSWHRARLAARWPVTPGWSVQATVDEPVALLRAFAAHHLALGAAEVHLFLDRDNPDTAADLRRDARVRVTICDAAYWRASRWRGRPILHTSRQVVNAANAYRDTAFSWMLFADADEFLVCPPDFAGQLAAAPPEAGFLRIEVAERCYAAGRWPGQDDGLYGGMFRRALALGPKRSRTIYGPDAEFLRKGVLAHNSGKSIVRTRQILRMGLHWPKPFTRSRAEPDVSSDPAYRRFVDGAWMAHYDGLTPLHWLLKLLRKYQLAARAAGPGQVVDLANRTEGRKRQIIAVHEARGDAVALLALTKMQALAPDVVQRLRAVGGLVDITLDPDGDAARTYSDHAAPTVGDFDAALIERYGDLIAEFGLDIGA